MVDWEYYRALANLRGTDPRYEEAAARGDYRAASEFEQYYYPVGGGWYASGKPASVLTPEQMAGNTHYEFRGSASPTYNPPASPPSTPVKPSFDPKIEANTLFGKPMALVALGYARLGASPAPIVGPYIINNEKADFIVSFGVPADPENDRVLYKIYLDQELAWSSVAGGLNPGDGTFSAESFGFTFRPGTLTQAVCSLETEKFPGDECAYRPQILLELRNLPIARFMELTGKPVPYVAIEIGEALEAGETVEPATAINLGTALERIAHSPWAGYTPDTFEAVGITDVVGAILIRDNFTVIQLCQTVTREYRNIDLLVSDKTRMIDRGRSVGPNFRFNRNSIVAGDDAIVVARAGATEQRREHELVSIDPDQDYTAVPSLAKIPRDPMIISAAVGKETATVPLVLDADTRQALAIFSQQYEENARRKVRHKALVSGYGIEPGDLYALTDIADGFDNEVFKCLSTTHGANWMVDIDGEAILRCSIYHEPVPGTAVFASGGAMGGIRYCYVAGSAPQDWHGHSTNDNPSWPFYSVGDVIASSYAKPGGRPTFLMGGNDFLFVGFSYAVMMISHDAINWTTVYYNYDRHVIYHIVWDADEQMFYANFTGPWGGVTPRPPTTNCLRSADGYIWEEVADDFWAHTADRFTPDGRAGYDPEADLMIRAEDLSFGGLPVYCTAYSNGVWMAGGGEGGNSVTWTSLDGGVNWSVATSGAVPYTFNSPVYTMSAAPQSDITG